ncbi:DUF2842 domain-containing protein [Ancylobacter dichloromethanicus]|uniref:DUF2842 domain-containing protein n=1 Tax=Ancylobacter dichloromethanicus TaxID=518825 RepID=A0A9W6MZ18_9HYPH|nr:DUF2842 domain-containing protein [Ancylobacter dichloromethanicus]MBS7554491.1 DUF2842 domain-containing protein [Ancylobacter dichloromethanicus]GLK71621.1 hypothetical protein GCM10017643_17360 [Ancylobacter dichloromethanicus]
MSDPHTSLSARSRKLIGTVLMVLLVLGWALGAMALAQGRVTTLPAFWQFIAYVVLGAGWIVPAGALIRWMQKHDRRPETL